ALQNIPKELFEAARVDGATPWKIVRYIKIPLVVPTIRLLFIFSVIGTSQLFTEALVLRPLGYVADNITPNLYLYLTAARDANYSYAGEQDRLGKNDVGGDSGGPRQYFRALFC